MNDSICFPEWDKSATMRHITAYRDHHKSSDTHRINGQHGADYFANDEAQSFSPAWALEMNCYQNAMHLCSLEKTNYVGFRFELALLGSIPGACKVFSCRITGRSENHAGRAAKLCFWTAEGAANSMAQVARGEFRVGDTTPTVMMDRIRAAEQVESPASRTLQVVGPRQIANK
ncbi:Uu.00g083260.m01.CDS01 [Anthostomella pinea]|uniref:Uu.00g083260.m01.CDS01 n=1 Tax=Anthostomella pinea TaxID=933095 RepID=A0AAI8YJK7_9PEZI|nr:Uu.00g083260.m01.CDS01 [Anthostomella pinea]